MRKFFVVACLALGFAVAGSGVASADHGYDVRGYPVRPSCNTGYPGGYGGGYRVGYGGYGGLQVYQGGLYRTYSVGPTSPFGYGNVGLPGYGVGYGGGYYGSGFGTGYGHGHGHSHSHGYGSGYGSVPRVQLRIGF
jgi:hypothetical protein